MRTRVERSSPRSLAAAFGRDRSRILSLAVAALLVACGGSDSGASSTPVGADGRPAGPRTVRRVEAPDLFPADLDLLVRVDVARMRAAIGPAAASGLSTRAGLEAGEDEQLFSSAMSRAAVVWIGLRLADIEAGDRVVAIEGDMGGLSSDPMRFRPVEIDLPGVTMEERADPPSRSGTARIIRIGDRTIAFVSPIEVDSVARVLRAGPDERRGDPIREGIVSLDLRPRRLPASLERRFPSIGAIIAGIKRIRAAVVPVGDGVRLDAEINARNKPSAERAHRFLSALRDNVAEPQSKSLMSSLSIEQVEETLRIRWTLPAKALAALIEAPASAP